MKSDRMLIKLMTKSTAYGVALKKTDSLFRAQTKGGIILPNQATLNPADWVPTKGTVVYSCMPEVSAGDIVHMEYFGVIINLGKWFNEASESDDRNFILGTTKSGEKVCSVFVKPKYLYFKEDKKGVITMLNDYNRIEPITHLPKSLIGTPLEMTNIASCTHGKFAGETIIFHKNAAMTRLERNRIVVQSQWVEAVVKSKYITPVGDRVMIKPDPVKEFTPEGIFIPVQHREVPTTGTVIAVGDNAFVKKGDRVKYNPKGFTIVNTVKDGVCLLFNSSLTSLTITGMPEDLNPMQDRILVRPDKAESITPGGIIIPEQAQEKPQRGTVVKVGPGRDTGTSFIKMWVNPGDRILFGKYSGFEIEVNKEKLLVMTMSDVVATITDGE